MKINELVELLREQDHSSEVKVYITERDDDVIGDITDVTEDAGVVYLETTA